MLIKSNKAQLPLPLIKHSVNSHVNHPPLSQPLSPLSGARTQQLLEQAGTDYGCGVSFIASTYSVLFFSLHVSMSAGRPRDDDVDDGNTLRDMDDD